MSNNLLHGDSLLITPSGKSLPLKEVVANQIKLEVISVNQSGIIEKSVVKDWVKLKIDHNPAKFKHIEFRSIEGGGKYGVTGTPGLKIYTECGWANIEDIKLDRRVYSKYSSSFNGTLKEFLSGILCCDSFVQVKGNSGYLKLQDSNNSSYVKWKIDKLKKFFSFKVNKYNLGNKQFTKYASNSDYELKVVKNNLFINRSPEFTLKEISPISLAVMIMDDGHFDEDRQRYILSFKRLKGTTELANLSKMFLTFGFEFECGYENILQKNGSIIFPKNSSRKIAEDIYKFVPNCMQYKLPKDLRGGYVDFDLKSKEQQLLELTNITEIRDSSKRQNRESFGYNLILEENNNFLVGGCKNGVFASSYGPSKRLELKKNAQT